MKFCNEYKEGYDKGYVDALEEYCYCMSYCSDKLLGLRGKMLKERKRILDNKKKRVRYCGVKNF